METPPASPALPPPLEVPESARDQARRFGPVFSLLDRAIADRVFPCASLAVTFRGEVVALHAAGRQTYDPAAPAVGIDTPFDLASVSKVVATTAMAMLLHERGALALDMPVCQAVPRFAARDGRKRGVTVRMLLAHASGLPGYARLFETCRDPLSLLDAAVGLPLDAEPMTRVEYSDVGFIVLGHLLEAVAGEPLDAFCAREVFAPLAMAGARFRLPAAWRPLVPPTENDTWFRRRVIQGEVQDENASVLGGVAGHAGGFARAWDVARFALCMLRGGGPILRPSTVELFTRREPAPPGTSRALGWDTPSPPSQSGRFFSPESYGHLGYAGTSLWIDPRRGLSVALLTNRTWPDRSDPRIKQVRPAVHDAIAASLGL